MKQHTSEPITITISAAMHLASKSRSTINRWISDGKFTTVKIGGSRLIILASFTKFLTEGEAA
jgi:predicted DNA-binding transcriptional regulator AlpA